MSSRKIAAYGSWRSPITSDSIVSGTIGVSQVRQDKGKVYWIEQRPSEGGRHVIVQYSQDGTKEDVTPKDFNARTRVHEYGGGAYAVGDGIIYFCNFADQGLFVQVPGQAPRPIALEHGLRFADIEIDSTRNQLVCVREDHRSEGDEATNSLVSIGFDGSGQQVVAEGYDFYSNPRISPDGELIAWLCWNHPNMPWDGTELWVGKFGPDGSLSNQSKIAGGITESIFQPQWSPFGILYFISDRSDWWNLYRLRNDRIEALCPKEADFGRAQWVFGMSTYAFASANSIICTYTEEGTWNMATLDPGTREFEHVELPFSEVSDVQASNGIVTFLGGAAGIPLSVVRSDIRNREIKTLFKSSRIEAASEYISQPESVSFATQDGKDAHGVFYRPVNPEYSGMPDERPPLIVKSHGGPTAAAQTSLDLRIQFWTTRGFAVLDVNYGGSTGYGRAYRRRLNMNWGIVDVDDCVNGALSLVERGQVDSHRLTITGGSAGGYTTLCALTFRDTFRAGASHYGICDLEALAHDTHKFESRYEESLVGPYPERADLYKKRSPIHFTDQLSCPLIIFQGMEDKIVPPNQAERMVSALREKGLPVAYISFEGEQHGFRKAENIKRVLDAELYFYSKIFGFDAPGSSESVPIYNLET